MRYSQPIKLVLFHITKVSINCHKGFHYLHLLNNYLFNYLNFSGLTLPAHGTTSRDPSIASLLKHNIHTSHSLQDYRLAQPQALLGETILDRLAEPPHR